MSGAFCEGVWEVGIKGRQAGGIYGMEVVVEKWVFGSISHTFGFNCYSPQ